jgi:tetratricopeptide (TPR) repeat protein
VLLRTARELLEANVPPRRVRDTLEALRSQLPAGRPLSAVTISALGNRVLVQDEAGVWEPDSGQLQIDFSVAEASPATLSICRGGRSRSVPDAHDPDRCADDWYDAGLDLEVSSHSEAIAAYERALALDPNHSDAHLNLGRLLHEGGRIQEAEDHYRAAARSDPQSARARYNLGVALEDQGKGTAAVDAYRGALTLDPNLAVAHFNLSRLFEADGRRSDALGHLVAYKRLIEGRAEGA